MGSVIGDEDGRSHRWHYTPPTWPVDGESGLKQIVWQQITCVTGQRCLDLVRAGHSWAERVTAGRGGSQLGGQVTAGRVGSAGPERVPGRSGWSAGGAGRCRQPPSVVLSSARDRRRVRLLSPPHPPSVMLPTPMLSDRRTERTAVKGRHTRPATDRPTGRANSYLTAADPSRIFAERDRLKARLDCHGPVDGPQGDEGGVWVWRGAIR